MATPEGRTPGSRRETYIRRHTYDQRECWHCCAGSPGRRRIRITPAQRWDSPRGCTTKAVRPPVLIALTGSVATQSFARCAQLIDRGFAVAGRPSAGTWVYQLRAGLSRCEMAMTGSRRCSHVPSQQTLNRKNSCSVEPIEQSLNTNSCRAEASL